MKYKEIPQTNGEYLINEFGQVFSSKTNKLLKYHKHGIGYISVCIKRDNKFRHYSIHRLLAETFLPNPESKPCVNHKNGIKSDNRLENLEWSTYSQNNKHAFDLKLNNAVVGSKRHTSTVDEETILKIRKMNETMNFSQISKELNLGYTLVRNACLKKSWKHI